MCVCVCVYVCVCVSLYVCMCISGRTRQCRRILTLEDDGLLAVVVLGLCPVALQRHVAEAALAAALEVEEVGAALKARAALGEAQGRTG